MYRIDRQTNSIEPLRACSFTELAFRERAHLQEWIAKQPSVLGEELLIVQKEFAGFSDTHERLDLLALDKQGSLVIIENKLDDAGRDVTWQALKYASYCSGLSREDIRRIYQDYLSSQIPGTAPNLAQEKLCEFLGVDEFDEISLNKGVTQRVILVAAHFRKEVTSTALWLMNFGLRLQCFKATPYEMGGDLFLAMDQIIPTPDTEDFMIGLASKARDEITSAETLNVKQNARREFWIRLLAEVNKHQPMFRNISPPTSSWVGAASGVRGLNFNFAATERYVRVELYIDRLDKVENEVVFDRLHMDTEAIHERFGDVLTWERLDTKRACRIKFERQDNVFDRERWPDIIAHLADAMQRLTNALRQPLETIRLNPTA